MTQVKKNFSLNPDFIFNEMPDIQANTQWKEQVIHQAMMKPPSNQSSRIIRVMLILLVCLNSFAILYFISKSHQQPLRSNQLSQIADELLIPSFYNH